MIAAAARSGRHPTIDPIVCPLGMLPQGRARGGTSVIRSQHFVAWVILCGTAFGSSTPTGDRGATSGPASLNAGAGQPATVIASVAALAGVDLRLSEPAVVPSAMSVGTAATPDPEPRETAARAAEAPVSETASAASAP